MTIRKFPSIKKITRPVLAQDPIIETTQSANSFSKSNFVKAGNYLIQASQNSSIILSGTGVSVAASISPQIINIPSDTTVNANKYVKPDSFRLITGIPTSGAAAGWNYTVSSPDKLFSVPGSAAYSIFVYSTDGITWISTTVPVAAWYSKGVYLNGSYVVAAYGYSYAVSSTNGISWTRRTMPVTANWNTIVGVKNNINVPSGFYAVAGGGTSYAASSTDGTTWTLRNLPVNGSWKPLIYDGTRLIAINAAGSQVASSTNGITWTSLGNMPLTPVAGDLWNFITYDGSKYLCIYGAATTSSYIAYSTNAVTWTLNNMPSSAPWNYLVYGNGYYLATTSISGGTSTYATSTDGITWNMKTFSIPLYTMYGEYDKRLNFFVAACGTTLSGQSYAAIVSNPNPDGEVTFGMYKV